MSAVGDVSVKPEARAYQPALEAFVRDDPVWLTEVRRRGFALFGEVGFPSRRSEAWRYFDFAPLREYPPEAAEAFAPADDAGARIDALRLPDTGLRLVLLDGRFVAELSKLAGPANVRLGAMATAIGERPEAVRAVLNRPEAGPDRALAGLNNALFTDGFVLEVGGAAAPDRPIEIVHVASGRSRASLHTRSLIALAPGSRATVIEAFVGAGHYWRNDALTVALGEGAVLERVALVEEGDAAIHLGDVTATLAATARLGNFALLLGGRSVRHEVRVDIAGAGASCRLDGAFVVAGREEANIVATVDHRAPQGETRELVKGVAADRAHGAFQGKIVVHEGAQKTDAHQLSRNLIVGRRAVIDTKPELEIYADDVKCAHGASVGELDEAAMFYLRARGIAADEARRLLVEGFVREAVERVEHPVPREFLLRRLAARLEKLESLP